MGDGDDEVEVERVGNGTSERPDWRATVDNNPNIKLFDLKK